MTLHEGSELTESQINENYETFIAFLKENFTGERLEKLLKLYAEDNYGLRLATAPAAGKVFFHNAWPGGYLQHIAGVEKASLGASKLYVYMGGTLDFTEEERIFAALHHDLGKLGNEQGEYFVPQTEAWAQKRGEVFKHNPNVQFWNVTDNALYILQSNDIKVTWKETLGIKLADGMYEENNAFYLKTYNPEHSLKTNLPYIIHAGDYFAMLTERDQWRKTQ